MCRHEKAAKEALAAIVRVSAPIVVSRAGGMRNAPRGATFQRLRRMRTTSTRAMTAAPTAAAISSDFTGSSRT